ncbi:hypothetical protein Q8A73_007389 [Channa argus]|nr:hypothetical protein Q8A73_007389 [Channa argus]
MSRPVYCSAAEAGLLPSARLLALLLLPSLRRSVNAARRSPAILLFYFRGSGGVSSCCRGLWTLSEGRHRVTETIRSTALLRVPQSYRTERGAHGQWDFCQWFVYLWQDWKRTMRPGMYRYERSSVVVRV